MKIYTRTGDQGETSLFGGGRVGKDALRVDAYGHVDELNSTLGWAGSQLEGTELSDVIREIQADLLTLGADLATPLDPSPAAAKKVVRIEGSRVERMEELIDLNERENEPLTSFILPGGDPGAAALHVCRTVCRRAERAAVSLARTEGINGQALVYLNRLSDLLFVLARRVNGMRGVEETKWLPDSEANPSPPA